MITFADWLADFEQLPRVGVNATKDVIGKCHAHTGPGLLSAKVAMSIAPSEDLLFEARVPGDIERTCEEKGWIRAICLGVLDVMLVDPPYPITNFRCVIHHVEFVDNAQQKLAFRLAARDAVRKFLR